MGHAPGPSASAISRANARGESSIQRFACGPASDNLAGEKAAPRPSGSATAKKNKRGTGAGATSDSVGRSPASDYLAGKQMCASPDAGTQLLGEIGEAPRPERHVALSRAMRDASRSCRPFRSADDRTSKLKGKTSTLCS